MRIVITDADMAVWTPEELDSMMAWTRSNGIDPENVRSSTGMVIDQGYIAYQEYIRNERGWVQLRTDMDEPVSEPRIMPMVTGYPPEEIIRIAQLDGRVTT